MDKLAIVRSMHTEENNHPQGTHYALTGHRPNPALKFPSLGSIISKELGPRNNLPPYLMVPEHHESDFFSYMDAYTSAFLGSEYDPIILPDPSQESFQIPDLSLPDTLTAADIADRRSFLQAVDRGFRQKEKHAEFGKMDRFTNQAMTMLLSPSVKQAFDLSQESDRTKEAYGRTRVGQSVLLARRLVEAGCRFVTASGYTHGALGHPQGQRPEAAGQAGPHPWTRRFPLYWRTCRNAGCWTPPWFWPWASSAAPPT